MPSGAPANRLEMIQMMRSAMQEVHAGVDLTDVDEEALALLAAGQLNLLAAEKRALILRQVASSPELAGLLQELTAMNAEESVEASGPPHRIFPFLFRVTQSASAIAACLVVALVVWRVIDAPVVPKARGLDGAAPPLLSPRDWALFISSIVLALFLAGALILHRRRAK